MDVSELSIQYYKDTFCEHITGGSNIYLYGCVILLTPECAMCLCVLVCICISDIKSEYQQKTT